MAMYQSIFDERAVPNSLSRFTRRKRRYPSITGEPTTPNIPALADKDLSPTPATVTKTSEGTATNSLTQLLKEGDQPDAYSQYWKTPVVGKMPLDQFVTMAGMAANAFAPETPAGRMGANLANMGYTAMGERSRREYEAPTNALKRRYMVAQIQEAEAGKAADKFTTFREWKHGQGEVDEGKILSEFQNLTTTEKTPKTSVFYDPQNPKRSKPIDMNDPAAVQEALDAGLVPETMYSREQGPYRVGTVMPGQDIGETHVTKQVTGYDTNGMPQFKTVATAPRYKPSSATGNSVMLVSPIGEQELVSKNSDDHKRMVKEGWKPYSQSLNKTMSDTELANIELRITDPKNASNPGLAAYVDVYNKNNPESSYVLKKGWITDTWVKTPKVVAPTTPASTSRPQVRSKPAATPATEFNWVNGQLVPIK